MPDDSSLYIDIDAFGHRFHILRGNAEDLITLERESAIYSQFWDEVHQVFREVKIKFLPGEVFQYVEANLAKQRFDFAAESGAGFEEALAAIGNDEIANRVRSYEASLKDGTIVDIRGCLASFFPPGMEELVCGGREDRYEYLPNLNVVDKRSLVATVLNTFPTICRFLAQREQGRPNFLVENEYDVQDLLFAQLRPLFEDLKREEWTPKHAGSAKRMDLVIPSEGIVVEVKIVRNKSHAKSFCDELKIDIESYHSYQNCKTLFAFVFDPKSLVVDPEQISADLDGLRVKGTTSFDVRVLIRG